LTKHYNLIVVGGFGAISDNFGIGILFVPPCTVGYVSLSTKRSLDQWITDRIHSIDWHLIFCVWEHWSVTDKATARNLLRHLSSVSNWLCRVSKQWVLSNRHHEQVWQNKILVPYQFCDTIRRWWCIFLK